MDVSSCKRHSVRRKKKKRYETRKTDTESTYRVKDRYLILEKTRFQRDKVIETLVRLCPPGPLLVACLLDYLFLL